MNGFKKKPGGYREVRPSLVCKDEVSFYCLKKDDIYVREQLLICQLSNDPTAVADQIIELIAETI